MNALKFMKDKGLARFEIPIVLLLFVAIGVLFFINYINGPLNRDEGGHLILASSILEGKIPYQDVVDHKTPGTYYIIALSFILFGKSYVSAKIMVLIFNIGTAMVLYTLGKELGNKAVGFVSGVVFLLALGIPISDGYNIFTEQFTIFFTSLSALFFLRELSRDFSNEEVVGSRQVVPSESKNVPIDSKKRKVSLNLVLAGVLSGVAVLVNQLAVFIIVSFFSHYFFRVFESAGGIINRLKNYGLKALVLIGTFSVPFLLVSGLFMAGGSFEAFFYYSISLNLTGYITSSRYIVGVSGDYLVSLIISSSALISISFLGAYFVLRLILVSKRVYNELFMIFWLISTLAYLAIKQFGHYLTHAMPPMSILAAIAFYIIYRRYFSFIDRSIFDRKRRRNAATAGSDDEGKRPFHLGSFRSPINPFHKGPAHVRFVVVAVLVILLGANFAYVAPIFGSKTDPDWGVERQLEAANYIKSRVPVDTPLFVHEAAPELYFLTDREPLTKYIDNTGLMTETDEKEAEISNYIIDRLYQENLSYVILARLPIRTNQWQSIEPIYDYITDLYQVEKEFHGEIHVYKKIEPPQFECSLSDNGWYNISINSSGKKLYSLTSISLDIINFTNMNYIDYDIYGVGVNSTAYYLDNAPTALGGRFMSSGDSIWVKSEAIGGLGRDGMVIHLTHSRTGKVLAGITLES